MDAFDLVEQMVMKGNNGKGPSPNSAVQCSVHYYLAQEWNLSVTTAVLYIQSTKASPRSH